MDWTSTMNAGFGFGFGLVFGGGVAVLTIAMVLSIADGLVRAWENFRR